MTILGEPRFQFLHTLQQQGILRHGGVQGLAQLAILSCDDGNALLLVHPSMLHLQHKSV